MPPAESTTEPAGEAKTMTKRVSILALLPLLLSASAVPALGQEPGMNNSPSAPKQVVAAKDEPQYREGEHYQRLPVVVETEHPDRIEVTEVFSYACIHCYTFDPILEEWRGDLSEDVAFRRVPATFNETWALLARMYYAAESLGVGRQMHIPLFEAIHKRGLDVRKPELAEELFWRSGRITAEDFTAAMESFDVATSLRQAEAQGRLYRVTGVPTLVVNGKYRIDSGSAGGYEEMLRIADFLIGLERKAAEPPGTGSAR